MGRLERGNGAGDDGLKHIVATTDGSERAGRAVEVASRMAQCFGSKLTLIHIARDGVPVPAGVREQASKHNADLEIVQAEKPAEAICDTALDLDADAIVIGNLGMSDRKEFLLGNVPNRVSHQAQCTVIIVDTRDEKDRKKAIKAARR